MSIESTVDDRRDGVEEGERIFAGQSSDRLGQRGRGQRAGRDDHVVPVFRRQAGDFAAVDRDERMAENAASTAWEKPSRSTASAPPAGT